MQQLIDYIEQYVKLDTQAIEALYKYAKVEKYAKKQHILQQGDRCNKIWFIKSGMVRKYHLHEGKEITCWIHTENETFTSLQSYSQQSPANENLQACENSELISITRQNSEKLTRHQQFITFSNLLMEKQFVNIDIHTKEFNQRDARGKYEYLKIIAPETVKRAKLAHIATIIGVTQETLSRIRREK